MAVETPVESVVSQNFAVKITLRKGPRDSNPLEVSNVRTGSMEGGKDAAYHIWSSWETFEKAWDRGYIRVEHYDPSNRVLEGTIDRIKRKGL